MSTKPLKPIEYERADAPSPANGFVTYASFFGGYVIGFLTAGLLDAYIRETWLGRNPDSDAMLCLAAIFIAIEVPGLVFLRQYYGPTRVGPLIAFVFGAVCGPTLTLTIYGIVILAK